MSERRHSNESALSPNAVTQRLYTSRINILGEIIPEMFEEGLLNNPINPVPLSKFVAKLVVGSRCTTTGNVGLEVLHRI